MFDTELFVFEQFKSEQSDTAGSMILACCLVKTKE